MLAVGDGVVVVVKRKGGGGGLDGLLDSGLVCAETRRRARPRAGTDALERRKWQERAARPDRERPVRERAAALACCLRVEGGVGNGKLRHGLAKRRAGGRAGGRAACSELAWAATLRPAARLPGRCEGMKYRSGNEDEPATPAGHAPVVHAKLSSNMCMVASGTGHTLE